MERVKAETANRELRIVRVLQAPVELVWEVWTDPEHIQNWWGPNGFSTDIHFMDLNENGEWLLTMHGPDGKTYPNKSIFKEIVKHEKIVYQHFNPNFLATVIFESQGDATLLNWCMVFETEELMETVVTTFKADIGMKQNVAKLEKYLSQKLNSK